MIYYLGLIGIAAFSITGVIAAGRKGMDIFSIVLLGVVTALGGGTLSRSRASNHSLFEHCRPAMYLDFDRIGAVGTSIVPSLS